MKDGKATSIKEGTAPTKEFLSYDTVRDDAITLAYRIASKDKFIPDVIYCLLRGGAYMANVISEYFKVLRHKEGGKPVLFSAVVARSYQGVKDRTQIMVDGWTYSPDYLRAGDKIMLIDDIFDTGSTINYLTKVIMGHGVPRADIKVVVHDFKLRKFKPRPDIVPDYYCRKFTIESPSDDNWIHYLSHELSGLNKEELEEHYYKRDPKLKDALEYVFS